MIYLQDLYKSGDDRKSILLLKIGSKRINMQRMPMRGRRKRKLDALAMYTVANSILPAKSLLPSPDIK